MTQTYYAARELNIDNKTYPAGTVLGTIETADAVHPDNFVNAIIRGFVTPNKPEPKPTVETAAEPQAAK